MAAPILFNPRELVYLCVCVYLEARTKLPSDVARRTLFFHLHARSLARRSFDVFERRSFFFVNTTPARACKQSAEPERRTFMFFVLHTLTRVPASLLHAPSRFCRAPHYRSRSTSRLGQSRITLLQRLLLLLLHANHSSLPVILRSLPFIRLPR